MRQRAVGQVDEVRKYVSAEVVDIDERYVVCNRKTFGERYSHEQRSEQARPARKGDGIDLVDGNAGLLDCGVDDRNDILLVCARGEFGNYTAVFLVYGLTCNDVRKQYAVADDGCRSVVARGLDA